jgi:indolepyruvate decarboxylase
MPPIRTTVGRYLVDRLAQAGVNHVFGVAGDYVLDLMDKVVSSPLQLVTTCNELNAGYAADGYARVKGIGALMVTYGVGGLSALNAVAGAYAERVPLIVISGAPHTRLSRGHVLMHHVVGQYEMQLKMYEKITVYSAALHDARTAPAQIDRALAECLRLKRPVYLEVPVDVVGQPCEGGADWSAPSGLTSDEEALKEAVREAAAMIQAARSPSVLVGMEVRRFKLQDALMSLLERGGFSVATTIGGKTALPETHDHYVGVYQGGFTSGKAHDTMEGADCLLSLGAWMTDITTGGFTAHLDPNRMISANSDKVRISHHFYDQVYLGDFITRLTEAIPEAEAAKHPHTAAPYQIGGAYTPQPERKLTVARFFERMNHFLTEEMNVVTDTGDVMFGATELHLARTESFISQDFYLSIGYSLPAALGVSLGSPERRTVVFAGDGAFQMTGQELGGFNTSGVHPIVFVMNNDGYVIERLIHDGPYNEIARWVYHRHPEALNAGIGIAVSTEGELEAALDTANRTKDALVLIEIRVDRRDSTPALAQIAENIRNMSKK